MPQRIRIGLDTLGYVPSKPLAVNEVIDDTKSYECVVGIPGMPYYPSEVDGGAEPEDEGGKIAIG